MKYFVIVLKATQILALLYFLQKVVDPDHLRSVILNEFNISLGMGLSKIKGKVFRIGHLGDLNEVSLIGVLGGIEMGLAKVGYKVKKKRHSRSN